MWLVLAWPGSFLSFTPSKPCFSFESRPKLIHKRALVEFFAVHFGVKRVVGAGAWQKWLRKFKLRLETIRIKIWGLFWLPTLDWDPFRVVTAGTQTCAALIWILFGNVTGAPPIHSYTHFLEIYRWRFHLKRWIIVEALVVARAGTSLIWTGRVYILCLLAS